MKKLLLLPLVAIGLALLPAKQADAQVSVGSEESDSVTPHTGTAITDIRDITGIIPVAIIAITVGTFITEHTITMGRRYYRQHRHHRHHHYYYRY